MTQLLLEARGGSGQSLCLLGVGNGNDVDLAAIAGAFERIALVDLDDRAVARAMDRLSGDKRRRVESHAPVDLSGVLPALENWNAAATFAGESIASAIAAARLVPPPLAGGYDVVASTCVLSQLIDSVYLAVAAGHPRASELALAVRNRHLETMIALLNPGGAGVLVTDFVSSETAPELAFLPDSQIPAAAIAWINARNFFTGTNPYAIRDYLRGLGQKALAAENAEVLPAWRWDIGAKQLAVSAVTFRRVL